MDCGWCESTGIRSSGGFRWRKPRKHEPAPPRPAIWPVILQSAESDALRLGSGTPVARLWHAPRTSPCDPTGSLHAARVPRPQPGAPPSHSVSWQCLLGRAALLEHPSSTGNADTPPLHEHFASSPRPTVPSVVILKANVPISRLMKVVNQKEINDREGGGGATMATVSHRSSRSASRPSW